LPKDSVHDLPDQPADNSEEAENDKVCFENFIPMDFTAP